MSGWESLPLLPLRCILEHLSVNDALAAMSTCRHWRSAMLLYEGHREQLVLKARHLEKNLFLTRVFRKRTQRLHIYIDCGENDLNKFMNYVLPQFLDSTKLNEVVFIGPIYLHLNPLMPFAKLNRIITESLVFKHSNFMQKLALMGCEMAPVKNENDRYVHKQVEYFSKPLSFNSAKSPADSVLSRCNVDMMMYSALKHIIIEYESTTTECLITLSQLNNLSQLTLNVILKKELKLIAIDWHRVNDSFNKPLDVAVNIISLPHKQFKSVIDNVLVEGMNLTSIKVMFCKTVHKPLLSHISRSYQSCLRELVWVDSPHEGTESTRVIKAKSGEMYLSDEYDQVNPFILLCWQCVQLRRLVIHVVQKKLYKNHIEKLLVKRYCYYGTVDLQDIPSSVFQQIVEIFGYWLWQYDVCGFVRLRRSLRLEASAVSAQPRGARTPSHLVRLLHTDAKTRLNNKQLAEINEYTDAPWKPTPWHQLHPGLRHHSTPDRRADYIANEVLHPLVAK